MKVGIIRCQQTEDLCPGTGDFAAVEKKSGAFETLGDCTIVGFVSCGGCPGSKAIARAQALMDRGAQAIALATCITKGNPDGFPCPEQGFHPSGAAEEMQGGSRTGIHALRFSDFQSMASRRRRRLVFIESYPKTPDVASGIQRNSRWHRVLKSTIRLGTASEGCSCGTASMSFSDKGSRRGLSLPL